VALAFSFLLLDPFGLLHGMHGEKGGRFASTRRGASAPDRAERRLESGDPAPDFDLARPKSDSRVRLSSFKGKLPVALVFGSYT
jgi:hypothetical protein